MGRDDVAVDPFAFLGEPFDEGGGVGDLAPGFGQRFALFGGHQHRQVLLVLQQQFIPPAQDIGAFLGGFRAPGREGLMGGFDGAAGFGLSHSGDGPQGLAGRRIGHRQCGAAIGAGPLAVEITLLAEQARIMEFVLDHRWSSHCYG